MTRISYMGGGLRYNRDVISTGAQTERWGDAGLVSAVLGGDSSPAAFLLSAQMPSRAPLFLSSGASDLLSEGVLLSPSEPKSWP